jgi:hypothetical protein
MKNGTPGDGHVLSDGAEAAAGSVREQSVQPEEPVLPGASFLSAAELELCNELRMQPLEYITYKTVLLKVRNAQFGRRDS